MLLQFYTRCPQTCNALPRPLDPFPNPETAFTTLLKRHDPNGSYKGLDGVQNRPYPGRRILVADTTRSVAAGGGARANPP